ncbi:YbhB/YbcL family Raf kinase inhibitor-like protein [Methanofollis formosanus]|uniref:YbhB/YbcL family Raf kinase inhibitor-like protein n=1 Tax=Methanofollis formosanus TaxID=299308 RepID=A0A8G1A1E8_9EURY|nr:YbhB/YbcL family Raf kinase inhibitor-like protein [Methanofollis formosanus]QYZ78327.1 YbhB/YbcL family Raf kinase inhibitor-like protein [Methanofollis formosanus]
MENPIVEIGFDVFPKRHTCDGEDISPEIHISRLASPYFAIILTDPGAKVDHWLIWNIPATDLIPEGIPGMPDVSSPISARQGKNDLGKIGYSGPCLPEGAAHEYYFNLYGTDAPLDLPGGASGAELKEALKGHTIQYSGSTVAGYRREVPELRAR